MTEFRRRYLNKSRLLNPDWIYKAKYAEIAVLNDKCDELQERCDDLEQYSRKCSIRISGIPKTQNENQFKIVKQQETQIHISPVGQRKADDSRCQILVRFMNYQISKRVFGAKLKLRHQNQESKNNQNVSPRNDDDE